MSVREVKQAVINQLLSKWEQTTCIFKVTFNKIQLSHCTLEPLQAVGSNHPICVQFYINANSPPTFFGSMANEKMECVLV